MAWRLTGTYWGPCSCKVACACTIAGDEPDQGWCTTSFPMEIRSGNVDGADMSGAKVVWMGHFPASPFAGNGTARLYFDPAVPQEQRGALESVLKGERGGLFEALASLISRYVPSAEAPITLQKGEQETRIRVGDYGEFVVQPLRNQEGKAVTVRNGVGAFVEDTGLARGTGSYWKDPELREWESGGHAEYADFDWRG